LLKTSDQFGDLAAALAKAQGEFQPIKKDRTANAGTYSYDYADLAATIEAVRPALSKHGLSYVQPVCSDADGSVLVTRLMHASGQYIEGTYRLDSYDKPQDMGSALTYARRYSLTSMLGIAAEEDDDGRAAQGATPRERSSAPSGSKPPCPQCKKTATVYQNKPEKGPGFYCWKQKGGCGANWVPQDAVAKSVDEALPREPGDDSETRLVFCPVCKTSEIGTAQDGAAFCKKCGRGI